MNDSNPVNEHKAAAPDRVSCAVITVSDTRTLENDTGGALIAELLQAAGHDVHSREIIPDEPAVMKPLIQQLEQDLEVDAILMTGGTGISSRDQTYETVTGIVAKPLTGYGELFRMLSYQQIGSAAILSRAVGGLINDTVILTMPGSPKAVQLAMNDIILPEICHLVREAKK
ncbi:MAG: molybdenum cofactor biosynthesis protein B [Pirellulaceae bacterium]